MKIDLKEILVRDLVYGYHDDGEGGVVGFGGKLDIRPPHQREFVYKDAQRDAVIRTIRKGFPLNVMYWAVRDDGTYEIIDGQQRTISIAQYVSGVFSFERLYIHNLTTDQQNQILDYVLMIYFCEGSDSEKLEWFETINIAGEKLEKQELRNAVYSGSWVTDAKRYFSRRGCVASKIGTDYLKGSPIRQAYLETAIKWINDGKIEDYMSVHQHEHSAVDLWNYFQNVVNWVKATFPNTRSKFMRGVDWGSLYNQFKDKDLNPDELETEVKRLVLDDDVEKKQGIYPYLLTGDKRYLNLRVFSDAQKQKAFEKQNGVCLACKETFKIHEMEGDHKVPWVDGGETKDENCQMLCRDCNRQKGQK